MVVYYLLIMYICGCVHVNADACGVQKRGLIPLRAEVTVVSHST